MFDKMNRQPFFTPDDGAGEGGDGQKPEGQSNELTIEQQVQAAVDKATAGLKKTNADLKAEKSDIRQKFDGLAAVIEKIGGEDGAKALLEMKTRFEANNADKLLAEGKTDEWLAANVKAIKGEHEQQLTAVSKKLDEALARGDTAAAAFANLKLDIAVREACSTSEGFRSTAVEDALLYARNRFTFDQERGLPVMKDANGTVILGKDGETPMSVLEDLEAAKATRRHWWEGSQGAGASGGVGGGASGEKKIEDMTLDEYRKHRATLGMSQGGQRLPGS